MNTSISLHSLAYVLGLTALSLSALGCPDFERVDAKPPLVCNEDAGDGECKPPPVDACTCTLQWAPVCGVNDKTYGNACQANCAKVKVAHRGECDDDACVCPEIYAPVCGEDGVTYDNSCAARCADASIDHEGRCKVGECSENADCAEGEVCHPDSHECQAECTISCLRSDPVCGRDGVTYDCGRADATCHGAAVAYEGECGSGCAFAGKHYAVGESFLDDCNRCTCDEDGGVACTAAACNSCDYDAPGRNWTARSERECSAIRFACPSGMQPFFNACGCGCEPLTDLGCKVGGCSSQLCVDAGADDPVSTCEWREEYACFRDATCERQSNGRCGWTPTAELEQCLAPWR